MTDYRVEAAIDKMSDFLILAEANRLGLINEDDYRDGIVQALRLRGYKIERNDAGGNISK